jgi:hypothetical protein
MKYDGMNERKSMKAIGNLEVFAEFERRTDEVMSRGLRYPTQARRGKSEHIRENFVADRDPPPPCRIISLTPFRIILSWYFRLFPHPSRIDIHPSSSGATRWRGARSVLYSDSVGSPTFSVLRQALYSTTFALLRHATQHPFAQTEGEIIGAISN